MDQNRVRKRRFPWENYLLAGMILFGAMILFVPAMPLDRTAEARMAATCSDLDVIQTVLKAYKADTGSFPTGTNGLLDLVRLPTGVTNWHGPYLDSLPKDPWGHEYIYTIPGKNPTPNYPYDLCSPGPHGNNPIYAHPPHIMTLK